MSDVREAPSSGRIEGGVHVYPVRVYYEDTDAGGIVYHANYLRWAERARTEMMRLLGSEHTRLLEETGTLFAVRRCALDFDKPARLDDALEVRTRVTAVRGASMELEQLVAMAGPVRSDVLVRISLTLFCLNRDGRPARLPEPVRRALSALDAADPEGGTDSRMERLS